MEALGTLTPIWVCTFNQPLKSTQPGHLFRIGESNTSLGALTKQTDRRTDGQTKAKMWPIAAAA